MTPKSFQDAAKMPPTMQQGPQWPPRPLQASIFFDFRPSKARFSNDFSIRFVISVEDLEGDLIKTFSREGNVPRSAVPHGAADPGKPDLRRQRARKGARLLYDGSLQGKATAWMQRLLKQGLEKDRRQPRPKPNAQQQACIRKIVRRCVFESEEELRDDAEYRSEPLSLLIHSVEREKRGRVKENERSVKKEIRNRSSFPEATDTIAKETRENH